MSTSIDDCMILSHRSLAGSLSLLKICLDVHNASYSKSVKNLTLVINNKLLIVTKNVISSQVVVLYCILGCKTVYSQRRFYVLTVSLLFYRNLMYVRSPAALSGTQIQALCVNM